MNMELWYSWCVRVPEEHEDTVRFRGAPPNPGSAVTRAL